MLYATISLVATYSSLAFAHNITCNAASCGKPLTLLAEDFQFYMQL